MGCTYCGGPLSRVDTSVRDTSLRRDSNGHEVWRCIVCGADQRIRSRQKATLAGKLKSGAKARAS